MIKEGMIKVIGSPVFASIYRRRTINNHFNPRRVAKKQQDTIYLYHFTHPSRLNAIRLEGLNIGDVPVKATATPSAACFNNAVWLTAADQPDVQTWGAKVGKNRVRLTIKIDAADLNLWHWPALARYLGINNDWYDLLNKGGSGKGQNWYVYCNDPIPPQWIVDIHMF